MDIHSLKKKHPKKFLEVCALLEPLKVPLETFTDAVEHLKALFKTFKGSSRAMVE